MNTIFSTKELQVRKWWLVTFLILLSYECFMAFQNPYAPLYSKWLGLSSIILARFAMFYCGYKKMGTRWLTFTIWSYWISFSLTISLLLGSLVWNAHWLQLFATHLWTTTKANGIFLSAISYPLSLTFLYLTVQLRKINKSKKPPQIQIVSN
ncbi:MAG TPA: hypothetical protein VGO47_05075 [Chlamydiales bacterium]|nr:hypothetical protein [Chlamydiales bacterium]